MEVVRLVVLVVEVCLVPLAGYLILLTIAAWFAPRRTPLTGSAATRRFLILVPAHDEERLLPGLLENLKRLDYPADRYAVHVVADNCTDLTARRAREAGVFVHERHDAGHVGKGYALQWLLREIWCSGEEHDGIVILDADSIVSPNFLTVMDALLSRGEHAIQAYYAVRNAQDSWGASLRSVALAAIHYLRPLGRTRLGLSVGLKGNGMVFSADLARRHAWPVSLTEDIEYHMALVLSGARVAFAPDAVVSAEMPATLRASHSQQTRWERGRADMLSQYFPRLVRASWERRSLVLLDAAIEQLIPPLSVLASLSIACLAAAAVVRYPAGIALGLALTLALVAYVLAGVALARIPRQVYRALAFAPAFVVWKIWLYLRVIFMRRPETWVRTTRNR